MFYEHSEKKFSENSLKKLTIETVTQIANHYKDA